MSNTDDRNGHVIDWYGLYGEKWVDLVPAAMKHPAKFSRALIRKIYDHLLAEGKLKAGDNVIDPFGGVALGSLDAMRHGLNWYGCELETHFHQAGNGNIENWHSLYGSVFNKWGTAVLVNGDSRQLRANLAGDLLQAMFNASTCICSPPFGAGETRDRTAFSGGEIASMMTRAYTKDNQGNNASNLAHLDAADAVSYALALAFARALVSSPPYMDAVKAGEGTAARHDPVYHKGDNAHKASGRADYGTSAGNLGNDGTDQFWEAARQIVTEVYETLEPGGVAVWICKDFIRNGERVPFCDQWRDLGLAVGFEPYQYIRAWQVEDRANARALFDFTMNGETIEAGTAVNHTPGKAGTVSGARKRSYVNGRTQVAGGYVRDLVPMSDSAMIATLENGARVKVDPVSFGWDGYDQAVKMMRYIDVTAVYVHYTTSTSYNGYRAVTVDLPATRTRRVKSAKLERKTMFRRLAEAKGSPRIDYEVCIIQVKPKL